MCSALTTPTVGVATPPTAHGVGAKSLCFPDNQTQVKELAAYFYMYLTSSPTHQVIDTENPEKMFQGINPEKMPVPDVHVHCNHASCCGVSQLSDSTFAVQQ